MQLEAHGLADNELQERITELALELERNPGGRTVTIRVVRDRQAPMRHKISVAIVLPPTSVPLGNPQVTKK
jgi:hypothetical protein